MNKLTEWLTEPFLKEDINIPVKVGDTILVGKFKNKKMKIKTIGKTNMVCQLLMVEKLLHSEYIK